MSHNRKYDREEVETAMKKMPTFADNKIDFADLAGFLDSIGYTYTAEQMVAYEKFLNEVHNGKLDLDIAINSLGVVDDTKELMRTHIEALDLNKDGVIDEVDFKAIVELMLAHDPAFPKVDYEKFVEEADTAKDGKVSIDEAVEWFSKNAKH
ncbi:probable calcium-binding protein CML20 [Folsomia candida]|uniref:Calcium-binding protein 1 n=1 Tax=Folsomia candida TaxID=158441 RepID=A0A226DT78_FOLCA|nr:probable calcium-binding protein CML20 [Folsomia candida]OXA48705.1 Calcium-binding protein 1 [Folsomia candida]